VIGDEPQHRGGPRAARAGPVEPAQPGQDGLDVGRAQVGVLAQGDPWVVAPVPHSDPVDPPAPAGAIGARVPAQPAGQVGQVGVPGQPGVVLGELVGLDLRDGLDGDQPDGGAQVGARPDAGPVPAPERQRDLAPGDAVERRSREQHPGTVPRLGR
jgi:hypothetical protein